MDNWGKLSGGGSDVDLAGIVSERGKYFWQDGSQGATKGSRRKSSSKAGPEISSEVSARGNAEPDYRGLRDQAWGLGFIL